MNLLVVGYGIVGKSVVDGLMHKHNVDVHDPPAGYTKRAYYEDYDGIILCLPTPSDEFGGCDDSLVTEYISDIRLGSDAIPILLKSTTSIETIKSLKHDPCLTFNPEFLTESNAEEGFLHQKFAIFGGNQARFWSELFISSGVKIDEVRYTSMVNAAFAKYGINTFLATKVVFFNQLREVYGDYNFDELTELISLDKRIGNSHMMVPGPDGEMGFGGMCFPKDTKAFALSSRVGGKVFDLLETVIEINDKIRK